MTDRQGRGMRGARRKITARPPAATPTSARKRAMAGASSGLPAPRPVREASAADASPAAAGVPAERNVFRDIDRFHHATLASAFMGISPISLLGAWQVWLRHLSIAPGKQAELVL